MMAAGYMQTVHKILYNLVAIQERQLECAHLLYKRQQLCVNGNIWDRQLECEQLIRTFTRASSCVDRLLTEPSRWQRFCFMI